MKYIITESQYDILIEGKYDSITSNVVRDIMDEVIDFIDSDEMEEDIEFPEYETPKYLGKINEFVVELYLRKQRRKNYKIDADAPGDLSENNIRIIIYLPKEGGKELLNELYYNLIYTFRHEFEHWLQVISDYSRVTADEPTNLDSTLFKRYEIEPQIMGYYLQSKKQKKPCEDDVREHLKKLVKNRQHKFKNKEEMEELISLLVSKGRQMKLKI